MDLSEQSERMQSYYNLQHDPFGAVVDSMVFSGAGGRYETAETIRHLMAYSHQDSLLIGAPGTGKRMLAQQVLKMLEDQWRIAWIDGSETETLTDLLREIVGQFGLGLKLDDDTSVLVKRIVEITSSRSDDEAFLIVVQFADRLPREVIEHLNFLRSSFSDLAFRIRQLWLVNGLDQFSVELNEEDWYIHSLSQLSDQDAEQYLKDRLIAAGHVDELPFESKDVARLNQMANGIPSQLNELARDYLIGATFKTAEKRQSFPLTHVIAGLAALSLVVIAVLYNASEKKNVILSSPVKSNPDSMSSVEKKLADAIAKVEAKQQGVLLEPSQVEQNDSIVSPAINEVESDSEADSTTEIEAGITSTESKITEVTEVKQPDKQVLASTSRLLQRGKANEFTLQLIGVREKVKLENLVSLFEDPAMIDVVQTEHQGKPWYVLIHGQYADKSEAKAAISHLPAPFKTQEPWIRSFESIRADVLP